MSLFIGGREFAFLIFIISVFLVAYFTEYTKKHDIPLKQLPSYDAIREGVGRAAELGKTVVCSCGQAKLDSSTASATLAGFQILSYVAQLCAEYGVRLIVPTCLHAGYPIQVERVREAYRVAGVPDAFKEEDVRFLSPNSNAFAAGTIAIFERENVATNIMVGFWSGITLIVAENSARLGLFGVGGSEKTTNIPFFIPTMDYTIIGEEMYALGSYIEKEPQQIGNLVAKDGLKVIAIGLILLGALAGIIGFDLGKLLIGG